MVRTALIMVTAALAFAATFGPIDLRPAVFAQESETTEPGENEADVAVIVVQDLDLGDVYVGNGYELVVERVIQEPSTTRLGWTEVRASVSMRNTSGAPFEYSAEAFIHGDPFPSLLIVDANGIVRNVDRIRPDRGTAPLSVLLDIEPELSARWVVGYQVPTVADDDLTLQILDDSVIVGLVDLNTENADLEWPEPTIESVLLGESIEWTQDLLVTPEEVGSMTCGDPAIEPITQIVTVTFTVRNRNATRDVSWPGTKSPAVPATAQWSDGSSGRFGVETYVGVKETLVRRSGEWVMLPPGFSSERAFILTSPRDARLGSFEDLPAGIYLNRPALAAVDEAGLPTLIEQPPLWLDLSGASRSVGIDAGFCDLGSSGAPTPYAYAPQAKFQVFGEPAAPDQEQQDALALDLLRSARAAAGRYYDANGQVFTSLTAAALERYAPQMRFFKYDVATQVPESGFFGDVFFALSSTDARFIFFITQSESGAWLCSAGRAYTLPLTGAADNPLDAGALCWAAAFEELAAAQAQAELEAEAEANTEEQENTGG